jgi:hypothetical protein
MAKYQEKIFNVETGETTYRDLNAKEIELLELSQQEAEKHAAEIAAKETARQAILDKLGLTSDEAETLLS